MVKDWIFFKRLFFPLTCMLVLMGIVSGFSHDLASHFLVLIKAAGADAAQFKWWTEVGTILFFTASLLFLRTFDFSTIFKGSLALIAILLIACLYFFQNPWISYVGTTFCSKLSLILGWGYLNQITNPQDGSRYYFLLATVSGILLTLARITPLFIVGTVQASPYLPMLLLICLAALTLTLPIDQWIQRDLTDKETFPPLTIQPVNIAFVIGSLAIVFGGLKMLDSLNNPWFVTQMRTIFDTAITYSKGMEQHKKFLSTGILIISVLSVFLGPLALKKTGWRWSLLAAPIVGFISLLLLRFYPQIQSHSVSQTLLKSVESCWVFPLIQIAVLTYLKKDRFFIQGMIFLSLVPLLQLIANLYQGPILLPSILVLLSQVVATTTLANSNQALVEPVRT